MHTFVRSAMFQMYFGHLVGLNPSRRNRCTVSRVRKVSSAVTELFIATALNFFVPVGSFTFIRFFHKNSKYIPYLIQSSHPFLPLL
jgi:hypothetical protein